MLEWVIKGDSKEIFPLIEKFCQEFNKTIEEMKDREITFLGRKIGKKVGEVVGFVNLMYYKDEEGVKVDLLTSIPDVFLFKQKNNLTKHIEEFLKKNNIKADIKVVKK